MRLISIGWLLGCAISSISGCATVNSPDTAKLSGLPIVEFGNDSPGDGEYILFVRSGKDIPAKVTIAGSMLAGETTLKTTIQLKKDIYLYKQWTSLDGKSWGEKNINLQVGTGLGVKGGIVNIAIDEIRK